MKWIIFGIIVVLVALAVTGWHPWRMAETKIETFKLTSPAFANGDFIGAKYTCDEQSLTPPLRISGVPKGAKSLVLVMDDPDVPKAVKADGIFDHWVVYNIPPADAFYDEGQITGALGANGRGEASYAGPCPPTNYEPTTHRYFFRLYATDIPVLNFIKAPTKQELLTAIDGHVIAETELMGKYDRLKTVREND